MQQQALLGCCTRVQCKAALFNASYAAHHAAVQASVAHLYVSCKSTEMHPGRNVFGSGADLINADIALSKASMLPQGPVNKMWLLTSFLIGNCKRKTKS